MYLEKRYCALSIPGGSYTYLCKTKFTIIFFLLQLEFKSTLALSISQYPCEINGHHTIQKTILHRNDLSVFI